MIITVLSYVKLGRPLLEHERCATKYFLSSVISWLQQLKRKYDGTASIEQLRNAFDLSEESLPGICDRLVQKVVTRVRE